MGISPEFGNSHSVFVELEDSPGFTVSSEDREQANKLASKYPYLAGAIYTMIEGVGDINFDVLADYSADNNITLVNVKITPDGYYAKS